MLNVPFMFLALAVSSSSSCLRHLCFVFSSHLFVEQHLTYSAILNFSLYFTITIGTLISLLARCVLVCTALFVSFICFQVVTN